jgi:pimeloyl-ACP methyl ester carboxylesterase
MATDVLSGMRTNYFILATILFIPDVANAQLTTSTTEVVLHDKTLARVESGQLQVPESRTRPSGRKVTIPFYRLKSEAAAQAAPIFLLAGGPGSSWLEQFEAEETNREARFYQTIADVVLFDQRGSGRATPAMTCGDSAPLPPADAPLNMTKVSQILRNLLVQCRDRWQAQGVDLAAYNTVESAADVNDLRLALGYRKITLIGGSYGSHLALQFMRQFPDAVDRVVIFGVEGPDHTWDDPAGALHTLERIAAATEQSPEFRDRIPEGGLLKTLERVIERLDVEPQMVTVATGTTNQRVLVDGARMRRMVRANAGRKSAAWLWPEMILAMDHGDFTGAAQRVAGQGALKLPDPVHFSMDCASGASPARKTRSRTDPARGLLGDVNVEYEVACDVWPFEDLGPAFRENVVSNIPTLIVQGTWDTSTPLENARAVAATLTRATLIEVVGGNHGALYNLFERWPPMRKTFGEFLAGRDVGFPATVDDTAAIRFARPR